MHFHKRWAIFLLAAVLAAPAVCHAGKEIRMAGETMGTTYHITVVTGYFSGVGDLQEKIDRRLDEVNRSMSTYLPNSEINRFNRFDRTEAPFAASPDFYTVMSAGSKIFQWTGGAWDGTVGPLVALWGFGRSGSIHSPPSPDAVRQMLLEVGFDRIRILEDRRIQKLRASVAVDLASIAKGYGVDVVAGLIRENGFKDFLVEIGGEVYASGVRKDGNPWRIGINTPQKNAKINQVYKAVSLSGGALATSGSYRIFFESGGKTYSHIIDPRTGYPVENRVVSATVMAESCTIADGLATALMVMGPEAGIAMVDKLSGVSCLIIVQEPDGQLTDHSSRAFPR